MSSPECGRCIVIEYVEAFHKAFGDSPRLFILCAALVGAILGASVLGGLAWIVDRGFQKSKTTETASAASSATKTAIPTEAATVESRKQVTREQATEIVNKIVERYKKKHSGNRPTVAWVNQKLKEQGQIFTVRETPAKGGLSFENNVMSNNGTVVRGMPPGNVDFSGNTMTGNGIVFDPSPPNTESPKRR
jgi:hypothetical protein